MKCLRCMRKIEEGGAMKIQWTERDTKEAVMIFVFGLILVLAFLKIACGSEYVSSFDSNTDPQIDMEVEYHPIGSAVVHDCGHSSTFIGVDYSEE